MMIVLICTNGKSDIYHCTFQLNKANPSDTQASFLDLDLSITNGLVQKKYVKREDVTFEIVNFPFLDGDVPRCPSYGVYIYLATYSFFKSMFSC